MEHITLFLDLDGVLVTQSEFFCNPKRYHPEFNCTPFNKGCVGVFNSICEIIKPNIVLSSDWRIYYTLEQMNKIFIWNNVKYPIIDFTPNLWNDYDDGTFSRIEECRGNEILKYVDEKQIGDNYLVIDDLDLSKFISEDNFIRTPKVKEGIKQTGILTKIVSKYKYLNNQK
ncbi:MAG: HAD domain-containing protein [bacterium]